MALPVFCVTEFMRVVTHRRVFNPPSKVVQTTEFIKGVTATPGCEVVHRGRSFCNGGARRPEKRIFAET